MDAVSLASVLQELTRAALDLFEPGSSLDDFLQRLTIRLGGLAALCLERSGDGQVRLLGSAGLSRVSRELPITEKVELGGGAPLSEVSWGTLRLPYPELEAVQPTIWQFPFATAPEAEAPPTGLLLLFFEDSQRPTPQYFGLVTRLMQFVQRALQHRGLDARVRESEHRLSEQKMLLEAENDATLDGILVMTTRGKIISYNRRLLELWGFTSNVVDGAGSAQALLPLAAQRVRNSTRFLRFVRRVLGAPEAECSDELSLRDGRCLELFTAPLRNTAGEVCGRGWYFRDITQRKQAEAERTRLLAREQAARQVAEKARQRSAFLAEASRRLAGHLDAEMALTQATEAVLPFLADWCAALVTEGDALRVCAVSHHEAARAARLGEMMPRRIPLELPEGAPLAARTGQPVLGTGGPRAPQPLAPFGLRGPEHLSLLQELGTAAYLAVPLMARGKPLGVLTLVTAQADRPYTQEDRELAENLAARVALAVDNARLHEEQKRAIHLRDEFLSVAAHELFTPLTSLRLSVQNLQRSARAPSAQLRIIDQQTGKLMRLVSELLDISRIRAGTLTLEFEEVDLGQLSREVAEQFSPELERTGTPLKLDVALGVTGLWDRLRLEQVVQSLLSNAVKYGERKPIEVAVKAEGERAQLIVRDQGMGISPENQVRIFEPFERAISSRHFGGLGLGLYTAQRIVRQLGGSIHLHSELGQGSTFIVELPRVPLAAHQAPPAAEPQPRH